jgi:hypothetical protein
MAEPTFTIDPNPAKTGNQVTFTSTSPSPTQLWDLDGDGQFNDAGGQIAHRTYTTPGQVSVQLRDLDLHQDSAPQLLSLVGPPTAFVVFPRVPAPGELVTFVYSSSGGTPTPPEWDLNGDGQFDDAEGSTATRVFPLPGTYPVSLRVTDADAATSTGTQLVAVKTPAVGTKLTTQPAKARLMTPFPVVRITGKVGRRGARIKRLTVNAPYGATIMVRCHGGGCPFRLSTRSVAIVGRAPRPSKTIRIRRLEGHLLRARATLKVFVSKANAIGKFTRFKIRKGKPPLRNDLCLTPGAQAPEACPRT